MNENINAVMDKIQEAISLMQEIDKVNNERDGELMDTYADIPNNLRKFNDLCRVFQKFEEFDAGLPSSEEFEKILAKGLSSKPFSKKIRYFAMEFDKAKDGDEFEICIRGIRCPTIEEANVFCRTDTLYCGAKVVSIVEISEEEAKSDFDFDNLKNKPIFGINPPLTIEEAFNKYEFEWFDGKKIVYSHSFEYAKSAFEETKKANSCLICNNKKFIAACHGGLEPID